jgi:molybdopterin converting factor small subunit
MAITIHIPTALRSYAGNNASVDVSGATVGDALSDLTTQYPDLSKHLRTGDGKLRSFVNVYLEDEDIRYLDKEATPVADGAELSIVPSIAGGV